MVLVRPWTDGPIQITGKSLTIAGDDHFSLGQWSSIRIHGRAASQRVTVRGLFVQSYVPPCVVSSCQGAVTFEDCRFGTYLFQGYGPAVSIVNSSDVTLIRSRADSAYAPFAEPGLRAYPFDHPDALRECRHDEHEPQQARSRLAFRHGHSS